MAGIFRNILFVATTLLCFHSLMAQPGFYVPKSGKIFFKGDTATIFSNVTNQGRLGIGKNAYVNFTAQKWENSPQSLITDESDSTTGVGGWVRFLSDSLRQQIDGGYNAAIKSGPAFSHIAIQNKSGVELLQTNTRVRKQIEFSDGLLYLHDFVFTIGDNDPGKIGGYDSLRYFVTGNKAGGGFLVRENISKRDGQVAFPVGSSANSYTPAAVQSNSRSGDDYYVTVFDSVRSSVFTGNNLANTSVNKTWQIGKRRRPDLENVTITLQHINNDEGNLFKRNRQDAYVSRFNGNVWDTAFPHNYPVPGYLTSGATLTNSGANSRQFNSLPAESYFTKLIDTNSRKTNLWFNAYRLDTGNVFAYWKTNPEVDTKMFVVQRKLSNETKFKDVATVASKTLNGYSFSELNYQITDPNNYKGISFYRLLMITNNSDSTYSDTIAVGNKPGIYSIMVWPNPTPDVFFVSVHKTLPVKAIVVWNALGQKVREVYPNGRTIIQMSGLRPGTYFISIVLTTDYIIETKKLIVTGY